TSSAAATAAGITAATTAGSVHTVNTTTAYNQAENLTGGNGKRAGDHCTRSASQSCVGSVQTTATAATASSDYLDGAHAGGHRPGICAWSGKRRGIVAAVDQDIGHVGGN